MPSASPNLKALVLSDAAPLRGRWISELNRLRARIQAASAELERFRRTDIAEFERWKNKTFGQVFTWTREVTGDGDRIADKLCEIRRVFDEYDLSEHDAYLAVKLRQENPEEFERIRDSLPRRPIEPLKDYEEREGGGRFSSAKDDGFWGDFRGVEGFLMFICATLSDRTNDLVDLDDLSEDLVRRFEAAYESRDPLWDRLMDEALDELGFFRRSFPEPDPGPSPEQREDRLRSTYRDLARLLHPDRHRDSSTEDQEHSERMELWYEVQEANGARDLDRMLMLATLVRIRLGVDPSGERISDLMQAVWHHEGSFQELDREIRRSRHHPAWKFPQKRRLARTKEEKVHREVYGALHSAEARLRQLLEIYERVRTPAGSRRRVG